MISNKSRKDLVVRSGRWRADLAGDDLSKEYHLSGSQITLMMVRSGSGLFWKRDDLILCHFQKGGQFCYGIIIGNRESDLVVRSGRWRSDLAGED